MGDKLAAKLITTLNELNNLQEISLGVGLNNGGQKWCLALAQLLQNPTSKIEDLDLGHSDIDDEGAQVLTDGVANNRRLNNLSLEVDEYITLKCWVAFSRCLINPNSSL